MSDKIIQPPLRDYQLEALEAMRGFDGESGLLVLATGLGKTRIFTEFIREDVTQNLHNVLILSHREELVYQPLTYLKDFRCGVELAEKHSQGQCIISASVQSLVNRLDSFNPFEINTIIVDEAHHAVAPTYRKVLEYFSHSQIFGFTATSHRGDGVGLGYVFDNLLFERDTLWGIENGYLTPMECFRVELKYDMGSVHIREDGDFNQADVARVMSGTAVGVVEAYEKYAKGQTIIFAASVDEVHDIVRILNTNYQRRVATAVVADTKNRNACLNPEVAGSNACVISSFRYRTPSIYSFSDQLSTNGMSLISHSPSSFLQHFVTFCVLSKCANRDRLISLTPNSLYTINKCSFASFR